ncbi:MAG: PD-(D/E)XK nuclease family protein [Xanthobacteraceae bacterium]
MSDGFSRHGIEHLSASSLNLWAAEPAIWVMERLLGLRSPQLALMARGKAVEDGVHAGLIDKSVPVEKCIERALATYDREMTLNPDERRTSERESIPGYVEHGLNELRQYGVPSAYQDRVELRLDDVAVPIIGFIDWRFDDHGLIVDLKTSERLPSAISPSHARQGAIYARAHGNYGMRFAYVKPTVGKKDGRAVVVYELDRGEIDRQLAALRQIAIRLERILNLSSDPRELCGLIVPDYERFHWNNPITRARGAEIFGF